MNKIDLLNKFLSNNCNEEEASQAMQYLDAEPGLLDELMAKSEWDQVKRDQPMMPGVESQMRRFVFSRTSGPILRSIKPVMAAAAILSALLFGLYFLMRTDNNTIASRALPAAHQTGESTTKIQNTTSAVQDVTLADHSTVTLYPGSVIEFDVNFIAARNINLHGKAIFQVTKNTHSPFTVHTGDISTTALGTRFLVDHSDEVNKVNVKLYEGRVIVKSLYKDLSVHQTFLEAGQQCFVDTYIGMVQVKPLYSNIAEKRDPVTHRSSPVMTADDNQLQFSQTPLPEVLSKLERMYKRSIHFNANDINGKYFTGSFTAHDSLSEILKVIAVMNDLRYNEQGQWIDMGKAETPALSGTRSLAPVAIRQAGTMIGKIETINPSKTITAGSSDLVIPRNSEADQKIVIDEGEVRYTTISLPEMLNDLQKQTKKKIMFNAAELERINFTGSIPLDQPVRDVLMLICRANGLTLITKKDAFHIEKQK